MVVMVVFDNQNVYRWPPHPNTPRLDVDIPADFVFCGDDSAQALYFAHRVHDIVIAVPRRTPSRDVGAPVGFYAILSFAGTGDDAVAVREELEEWADVLARVASLAADRSHGARFPHMAPAGC